MNEQTLILVENAEAHVLADWISIQQDLIAVLKSCKALERYLSKSRKDEEDGTIIQALWTSALIRYARCFATGKRRVRIEASLFAQLPGEPIETHQYYIDTRNKHVAHPVNVFEEVKVGILPSSSFPDPPSFVGTGHLSAFRVSDDQQGVAQLGRLATIGLRHVQTMIKQAEHSFRASVEGMTTSALKRLKPLVIQSQGGADAAKQPRQ